MNNYDQSSTGVNIELSICFDTDLAQIYFNDNFKVLQYSGYRMNSILVYGGVSDSPAVDQFDLADQSNYVYSGTVESLKNLVNTFYDDDEVTDRGHDLNDKDSLLEFIDQYIEREDLIGIYKDYFKSTFARITSRGYSQGDYSEVMIPAQVLEEMGLTVEQAEQDADLRTEIDHLLWNAPLWGNLEINGEDYYLNDYLPDLYDYDKDKLLQNIRADWFKFPRFSIVYQFLVDNLPDEPKYN